MKRFACFLIGFLSLSLLISCNKEIVRFTTKNPPPELIFPSSIDLDLILPPPLYVQKNRFKTIGYSVDQYFKIAIPPAVDMTGTSTNIRNSLSDMFYSSLFKTKRFSLLDRGEIDKIQAIINKEEKYTIAYDTLKKSEIKNIDKDMVLLQEKVKDIENAKYQDLIDQLKKITDGLMLMYITSDKKSQNYEQGKIGLDYRIVTRTGQVLYASSKEIGYVYNSNDGSLEFNRADADSVAEEIRQKFPNPDYQDFRIIDKRGNRIVVNAGKKDNITSGMIGYVIKIDQNSFGNQIIKYRAKFVVREVFMDTFNAELIIEYPEDEFIIPTIAVKEPIKMM